MVAISCNQQTKIDSSKLEINQTCDKIMEDFVKWNIQDACKLIKESSIIITKSEIDTLQNAIIAQGNSLILPNYGKPISYELAVEKTIKEFAAKRYYVLKFDKYFIKMSFSLYNNGKKWAISNFTYDDNTPLL